MLKTMHQTPLYDYDIHNIYNSAILNPKDASNCTAHYEYIHIMYTYIMFVHNIFDICSYVYPFYNECVFIFNA